MRDTIPSFKLDVGQMICGRDGEYVRLADHNERIAAEKARNKVLEEALRYAVKQVPELGTIRGIDAALREDNK